MSDSVKPIHMQSHSSAPYCLLFLLPKISRSAQEVLTLEKRISSVHPPRNQQKPIFLVYDKGVTASIAPVDSAMLWYRKWDFRRPALLCYIR